jgi:hypothetical protein
MTIGTATLKFFFQNTAKIGVLAAVFFGASPTNAQVYYSSTPADNTRHFTGVYHIFPKHHSAFLSASTRSDAQSMINNCRHQSIFRSCAPVAVLPQGRPACVAYARINGNTTRLDVNPFETATEARLVIGHAERANIPVFVACNSSTHMSQMIRELETYVAAGREARAAEAQRRFGQPTNPSLPAPR